MTTFYAATTNPGKLRDFSAAARVHSVAILPLPNLNLIPAPPENEPTFTGNAIVKATYYSRHLPGEIIVADDSGLEVDALSGAPGVLSARYALAQGFTKEGLTQDQLNNECLLLSLKEVPPARRSARYRCSLAAAKDGECLFTAEGTVEGRVLTAPRGSAGFGYDPLFYLPTLRRTMAQIDLDVKQSISHRGIAFTSLLRELGNEQP